MEPPCIEKFISRMFLLFVLCKYLVLYFFFVISKMNQINKKTKINWSISRNYTDSWQKNRILNYILLFFHSITLHKIKLRKHVFSNAWWSTRFCTYSKVKRMQIRLQSTYKINDLILADYMFSTSFTYIYTIQIHTDNTIIIFCKTTHKSFMEHFTPSLFQIYLVCGICLIQYQVMHVTFVTEVHIGVGLCFKSNKEVCNDLHCIW